MKTLHPLYHLGLTLTLAVTAQANTLINQRTSLDQKSPVGIVYPDGRSLALWNSYNHDGNSGTIVARWLSPTDVPDSNEWVVNQQTEGNQAQPAAALNKDGILLLAWRGPHVNGDSEEIIARLFDPNGTPLTDDIHINQNTTEEQSNPSVCDLTNGSFVIAWESEGHPDSNKKSVCLRVISANGNMATDEIMLSDTPSYTCRNVAVASCPDGTFTGTWLEDRSSNNIRIRSFNANGMAQGDSQQVNSIRIRRLTDPAIAVNNDSFTIVTWNGDPNAGSNDDIYARLYDPNRQPVSEQYAVNQSMESAQESPCVGAQSNGDFIIAWETPAPDDKDDTDLAIRRLGANGEFKSEEIVLCNDGEDQTTPTIATNDQGQTLLLWQSKSPDSSDWDVYCQYSPQLQSADLNNDSQVDFTDYALWTQSWPQTQEMSFDLYQDYQGNHLDLWVFGQQWLASSTLK